MDDSPLLEFLDPEQRMVATNLSGPLCVRAGAGTGKTRAITYRIAYGVQTGAFLPSNVLAVTFTSRAAGEMRSRLRDLGIRGVSAQTFHAAALRQLRYFWATAVGGQLPQIAEHKTPFVSQAAGQLGMSFDRVTVRDLASEVEWAKVSMIAPENYAERAAAAGRTDVAGYSLPEVAQVMRLYEEVKTQRGVIDFEDVLLILVGILLERPDIARQIRSQYQHFVVDEYQDVSPLQHRLLQLWLGERKNVCVVGDVSQTIYSFTGASSHFLARFTEEYPDATVIELVRDYRSTPQIVSCANEIIADDTSEGAVRLVSQLPSSVPIVWSEYADDEDEAAKIAGEILSLKEQGVAYGDVAILYRTNAQSAHYEAALSQAGIGYTVRGAERFFERREIREAMIAMRAAAREGAEGSLVPHIEAIVRSIGWRKEPPEQAGAARDRWEALNALRGLAQEMEQQRHSSVAEFVAELEERAVLQNAPEIDGVTLSSLHAAKGLEWEAVFLAGMSEGLMPISLAKGPEGIAEERRLLYVGVTRARQRLFISYAVGNGAGRGKRKASRFLTSLWPREEKSVSQRKQRAKRAASFAEDYPDDVALFERLVHWRAQVASETGRPAYTVFHDTTLQALAVSKPSTVEGLGRIRGIGATKIARWGEEILRLIAE